MMRHFLFSLFAALWLLLQAGPATAQGLGLKIATLAPEGTILTEALRAASDEIQELTEGRIFLKIYSGGVMGSDEIVMRKMTLGQLHGAVITSGALAANSRLHMVMNMPLLFHSDQEVDAVRAAFDQRLVDDLSQQGLVSMGLVELGFVYMMSNSPLVSLEDLRGLKPWVPEHHELGQELFSEIGVAPVPLPVSDVLTALQTGLVDTVANAPVATLALQWFTRVKYLATVPLFYSYGSLVFQDSAWNRISPEDQEIVRQVLSDMTRELDATSREDNVSALQTLERQGIQLTEVPPEELETLQRLADNVVQRWQDQDRLDADMLSRVRDIVDQVRAGR